MVSPSPYTEEPVAVLTTEPYSLRRLGALASESSEQVGIAVGCTWLPGTVRLGELPCAVFCCSGLLRPTVMPR